MSTKPLNQHEIRIRTVQALYLLEMIPDETVEDAMMFALTNDARLLSQTLADDTVVAIKKKTKKVGNVFSFTPEVVVETPIEATILTDRFDDVHKKNLEFLMSLVYGVRAKKVAVDEAISQYLAKNWSIKRLAPINRVILRLGTFEILFSETPRVVAINEAIELAKVFNDEKDAKFINAILTKIGE